MKLLERPKCFILDEGGEVKGVGACTNVYSISQAALRHPFFPVCIRCLSIHDIHIVHYVVQGILAEHYHTINVHFTTAKSIVTITSTTSQADHPPNPLSSLSPRSTRPHTPRSLHTSSSRRARSTSPQYPPPSSSPLRLCVAPLASSSHTLHLSIHLITPRCA
jgi:hypothetical protein